jgi:cytochrome c
MRRIQISVLLAALFVMHGAAAEEAGDIAAGERSWNKCRACHQIGEGARNLVGPHLNGLFGRAAGTAEGYSFSAANRSSGITWGEAVFAAYIKDPKARIPGTKMVFAGLRSDKEIRDLSTFLKQFGADGRKM